MAYLRGFLGPVAIADSSDQPASNLRLNDENLIYTNIDGQNYKDSYKISPNPNCGVFTISNIESLPDNNPELLLFNATGNLIYSDKMNGNQYLCNALKGKQNGLYFVKIGNHLEKIVKIK